MSPPPTFSVRSRIEEQVSVVYTADQSGAVENICGHAAQLRSEKAKRSVTVINGACNHNLLPRHRITNISTIS